MKSFFSVCKQQQHPHNAAKRSWARTAAWMLTLLGLLAAGGCASTAAPHVTAKVIYQHEDLAAELSTEWNR